MAGTSRCLASRGGLHPEMAGTTSERNERNTHEFEKKGNNKHLRYREDRNFIMITSIEAVQYMSCLSFEQEFHQFKTFVMAGGLFFAYQCKEKQLRTTTSKFIV